tara:strand:+ start:79 stop:912 length:834 start_codon:yes stop_codon:yes gene_type:complete
MKKTDLKTVYLVGAGPGDPDLLTVKAMKLLNKCDALVYDSLIPNEILRLVPDSCRRFFVGKQPGNHVLSQSQINKLLVEVAKDHLCVVRLKGGDPFLFGRGAEEAEFLVKNQINVEVVPGITSGMATPAYIGIPVTHREAGSSVTFVTGHESLNKQNHKVNWRSLAKATDGIVIYMGMNNLKYIIEELIVGGLDFETPVAIIHKGTLRDQRYVKSSLRKLLSNINSIGFSSPSIVIIGKVVDYQIEECSPRFNDANLTEFSDSMVIGGIPLGKVGKK